MASMSASRFLPSFLLGALSVGLVVGALAVAGVIDDDQPAATRGTAAEPTATPRATSPAAPRTAPASVSEIYAQVSAGVVFVSVQGGNGQLGFEGPGGGQAASGSGFLIDRKGSIVTNQHVVEDSRNVTVRFGEDGDPIRARVLGTDPGSDLALLRVNPDQIEGGAKPLELASSEDLRPGDPAIAIGSPFGLSGTVTSGIVSALDRPITSPNGFTITGAVQTDAAINPGNSGGPLLDGQGRVIGVNSQIRTGGGNANSGVGFAVPVDTVKDVVPQLERNGRVARGYLGVSSGETQPVNQGARVQAVANGGPADEGGLRAGDVIVALEGRPVRDPDDLSALVSDRRPGEKVELTVERGGERRTLTVELGTQPRAAQQG
jgi:S1-C subfamily serine protease